LSRPLDQLSGGFSNILTLSLPPHHIFFSLSRSLAVSSSNPSISFSGGCHFKSTKELDQYDNEPLASSMNSVD